MKMGGRPTIGELRRRRRRRHGGSWVECNATKLGCGGKGQWQEGVMWRPAVAKPPEPSGAHRYHINRRLSRFRVGKRQPLQRVRGERRQHDFRVGGGRGRRRVDVGEGSWDGGGKRGERERDTRRRLPPSFL